MCKRMFQNCIFHVSYKLSSLHYVYFLYVLLYLFLSLCVDYYHIFSMSAVGRALFVAFSFMITRVLATRCSYRKRLYEETNKRAREKERENRERETERERESISLMETHRKYMIIINTEREKEIEQNI